MTSIRPGNLGAVDGRLKSCPESPNCVCSFDTDREHGIPPLTFSDSPEAAMERLRQTVKATPRTRFVVDDAGYLHVEFRSLILRFVDDVEFLIDAESRVIHVRSASRLGYSDLGVNRRRIEAIRKAFAAGS